MATNSSNPSSEASGEGIARLTAAAPSLYERLGRQEGIRKLIKPFYADLRQHSIIGPIFNAHIQDWPAHLEKIADFWALQTGGVSRYRGGFGAAHVALGIDAEHFSPWLELWTFNSARQLAPREADEMNALARQLAERLVAITQGRRSLTIRTPRLPPVRPAGKGEELD